MSNILYGGQLNTTLSVGGMVLNDYRITIEDIEGGHRLSIIRGSEVQVMDIMDGKDGGADIKIDATLANTGEAADAKAVGEKLAELLELLQGKVDAVEGKGLSTNDFTDEHLQKLENMQPGDGLQGIKLGGEPVNVEDGVVNIPIAGESLGVVRSSNDENGITIAEDGSMRINAISLDMLTQSGSEVILGGGGA